MNSKARGLIHPLGALPLMGFLSIALAGPPAPGREKVVIDADMGQLNDDAAVLFMLAHSENVEILGVTLVAGNTWVEEGTAFALRQLEIVGRPEIPVMMGGNEPLMGNRQSWLAAEERLYGNSEYLGAFSRPRPPSYLDIGREPYGGYAGIQPSPENAVDFIVRAVSENPHQVTIFAIGPATNLALAVKKNPEIVPLVKAVYYMGGAIDVPGNTTPAAEFNWWFDPEAARICLRSPFPKQLVVPNDVAEKVYFTKEQFDRIVGAAETPLTRMFEDLRGERFRSNPDLRTFVWDALTAAVFLDPAIATRMEERYIDIDTNYGPNYGRSLGYHESRRRSLSAPENFPAGSQKVSILFDIDRQAFWDLYVKLMTKPIRERQTAGAPAPGLTLERLVDPASRYRNQDGLVPVPRHFFLEFENLAAFFEYVDQQAGRWRFPSAAARKEFADGLLRRGVESRVISMTYEKPLEVLLTHTPDELAAAVERVRTPDAPLVYEGEHWRLETALYRRMFLDLQQRWKTALNCWSASPSIAGRVLSNWYLIEEGIDLFGARYDSTEHFWQAVKYHPEVGLGDLLELLAELRQTSWGPWVEQLAGDQEIYLEHGYAVEFLRRNLNSAKLQWFEEEIEKQSRRFSDPVRKLQQRDPGGPRQPRYSALEEKVLWGDLADVFHLLVFFGGLDGGRLRFQEMEPVLESLARHRFDGVYLAGYGAGKVGFISPEFRQLMLEIWKVKFLEMERFRDVLRSTRGHRLLHYLNDGDSPDIPIPIYVGFLEQIRRMALQ